MKFDFPYFIGLRKFISEFFKFFVCNMTVLIFSILNHSGTLMVYYYLFGVLLSRKLNYFQVSFNLKVAQNYFFHFAKITQNTVPGHHRYLQTVYQ